MSLLTERLPNKYNCQSHVDCSPFNMCSEMHGLCVPAACVIPASDDQVQWSTSGQIKIMELVRMECQKSFVLPDGTRGQDFICLKSKSGPRLLPLRGHLKTMACRRGEVILSKEFIIDHEAALTLIRMLRIFRLLGFRSVCQWTMYSCQLSGDVRDQWPHHSCLQSRRRISGIPDLSSRSYCHGKTVFGPHLCSDQC